MPDTEENANGGHSQGSSIGVMNSKLAPKPVATLNDLLNTTGSWSKEHKDKMSLEFSKIQA